MSSKNNHYFIGYLLDKEISRKIDTSRNFILKYARQTGKVINYHTRFAYLGYMSEESFYELTDKLNNVFSSITEKFGPQECIFTNYDVMGNKTTYKKVALVYKNNNIEKIIAPFIRNFTDKALGYEPVKFEPHINLFNINPNEENKLYVKDKNGKTILQKAFLPKPNIFKISSIDILRGIPIKQSPGRQSKDDDMEIQKVTSFQLRGVL